MAFTTDFDMSAPTYIVYREGGSHDLTAPLAFFPAKDSDELFDALRAKFPHLKTHSERMRDATIEFLKHELDSQTISPVVSSMESISPWQQSFSYPSLSSTANTSPELANLHTPSFADSPAMQSSESRHGSTPAIAGMTGVFSLNSAEQPKQRLRRKMTEAEKVEYRKRRVIKACDKCAKRKRKCTHNQAADNVTSVATPSVSRVSKPSAKQTVSHQSHGTKPSQQPEYTAFEYPAIFFDSMDFDDFTLLSDDMMDYDNPFQPDDLDNFFQGVEHIDPQWLMQPTTGYASSYSSGSPHELMPLVPGNARPQVGLASDAQVIAGLEVPADLLQGLQGVQGLQSKNQGIVAPGHDLAVQGPAGLLHGLQELQGLQGKNQGIAARGNDVLLQESAESLHGLQGLHATQLENQRVVARRQNALLRTARGTHAPSEAQSQGLLAQSSQGSQAPHGLLQSDQVPLTRRVPQQQRALQLEQEVIYATCNGNADVTEDNSARHLRTSANSRSTLQRQDVLSWLQQSVASNIQQEALQSAAALTHTTSLDSGVRADIPSTPRPSRFLQGLSIHTDISGLSIRKPLSLDMEVISRLNGSDIKNGLATTQAILQEDSRTCTPRGRLSALQNPGLFAASKASIQGPTAKGFATSHLERHAERDGADIKRCTSPSSELFRLRREMSFAKDHTGGCQLSTRSIRVHPMLLEIHPPASSADLYGSIKTPDGSAHEQEPSDCVRPQCTIESTTSIETRSIHDEQEALSKAAPTQRYKEYQTIDRFWVRDHHGRTSLAVVAVLLLALLTCSILPAAMACLLAFCYPALDRSQDQLSTATRFAQRARIISSFRHTVKLCQV